MTTPVTIVGGFLGSGKTTFLRRLLEAPEGRRLAVVVNDFGDLNIDAALISEVSDDTIELTNGCLCCSARGDLLIAAKRLMLADPQPDGIVVEASGVARPDMVARSFKASEFGDHFDVQTLLTLVDADGFSDLDFELGELAIDQAAVADLVLLNKVDLAGPVKSAKVEQLLKEAIPHIRLIETTHARVPLELVVAGPRGPFAQKVAESVDASEMFDTVSWVSEAALDLEAFQSAMKGLGPGILRLKGFIFTVDKPGTCLLVQMVGRRGTIEPFEGGVKTARSELVAIMKTDTMTADAFAEVFDACISQEES